MGDISNTSRAKASAGLASHLSRWQMATPTGLSCAGSLRPSSITSKPWVRRKSATSRALSLPRSNTPHVMVRCPTPISVRISAMRVSRASQSPVTSTRASPRFDSVVSGGAGTCSRQSHRSAAGPNNFVMSGTSPQTRFTSASTCGHDRQDSSIGAVSSPPA